MVSSSLGLPSTLSISTPFASFLNKFTLSSQTRCFLKPLAKAGLLYSGVVRAPRSKKPRLLKKPRNRKLCFRASVLSDRSDIAS